MLSKTSHHSPPPLCGSKDQAQDLPLQGVLVNFKCQHNPESPGEKLNGGIFLHQVGLWWASPGREVVLVIDVGRPNPLWVAFPRQRILNNLRES